MSFFTELKRRNVIRVAGLYLVIACARWSEQRVAESDAALARLREGFADTAAYQIAEVYAYRGEKDQAFAWLERAHRQRDSGLPGVKADALLVKLHSDPRGEAFLREIGLADNQFK